MGPFPPPPQSFLGEAAGWRSLSRTDHPAQAPVSQPSLASPPQGVCSESGGGRVTQHLLKGPEPSMIVTRQLPTGSTKTPQTSVKTTQKTQHSRGIPTGPPSSSTQDQRPERPTNCVCVRCPQSTLADGHTGKAGSRVSGPEHVSGHSGVPASPTAETPGATAGHSPREREVRVAEAWSWWPQQEVRTQLANDTSVEGSWSCPGGSRRPVAAVTGVYFFSWCF